MSMNLLLANDNAADNQAEINWTAIQIASGNEHGMVFIDDETVNSIGRLINGITLTNDETVVAYGCENDENNYAGHIPDFGPSLLPVKLQDQVRNRLNATTNGRVAVALFNEILRLKLQISFIGKDHADARMTGVNWTADEVEVTRSNGYMVAMIETLGLGDAVDAKYGTGKVSFERFVAAVNDNGHYTDMQHRLDAFVECGRRQNATKVYWA